MPFAGSAYSWINVMFGEFFGWVAGWALFARLVCAVTDIIEDKARKLVTTPAYMLAQNIAEAANGIEKLVARVLVLAA